MPRLTANQKAEKVLTAFGLTMPETSAEMVQDLYFVRESKGWFKQHDWVIARFAVDDDIAAEIPTLKAWMVQSYCAVAPKTIARLVRGEA